MSNKLYTRFDNRGAIIDSLLIEKDNEVIYKIAHKRIRGGLYEKSLSKEDYYNSPYINGIRLTGDSAKLFNWENIN